MWLNIQKKIEEMSTRLCFLRAKCCRNAYIEQLRQLAQSAEISMGRHFCTMVYPSWRRSTLTFEAKMSCRLRHLHSEEKPRYFCALQVRSRH